MPRELHERNRLSWNEATVAHNSHKPDQAAFYRAGNSKLYAEDRRLLGDIRGRRVVHLQCNAGQDTLSLANMGAEVVGVDISDTAIEFARGLATEAGIAAEFVRADVYDWLAEAAAAGERFDIVYSSYGALTWLSDLRGWARGVAAILRPGGKLVVIDYHPTMGMFDEHRRLMYPYASAGEAWSDGVGVGDYVAFTGTSETGFLEGVTEFFNPHPSYEWLWGLADIVTAILAAELRLEIFEEYPWSNGWKMFDDMREEGDRRWVLPEGVPPMPLMYGMVARKAG